MKNTAVLLLSTPMALARKGVVAAISQFLIAHHGSVLHSDDHLDRGRDLFLSRLEWDLEGFDIPIANFEHAFQPVAERFLIKYHLALTDYRPKIAILVSNYDHCLADLLYRRRSGELVCDIVTIISNHPTAKTLADFYQVPFHLLRSPKDKRDSEKEMLELLGQNVDLIVLARYMQILGPDFVAQYLLRMINIHHSFLPAFIGAKPYHQASDRGVKLIGATSHLCYCEFG
jgi:formyltetrahydrofolate deformylase